MPELSEHTVAELDALAEEHDVEATGTKAEKVAALEAAGVSAPEEEPEQWSFQLRADYFDEGVTPTASFMVSEPPKPPRAVELADGQVYTTADRNTAAGLRDIPFLEEVA